MDEWLRLAGRAAGGGEGLTGKTYERTFGGQENTLILMGVGHTGVSKENKSYCQCVHSSL